jgi:hypothetical protein
MTYIYIYICVCVALFLRIRLSLYVYISVLRKGHFVTDSPKPLQRSEFRHNHLGHDRVMLSRALTAEPI